MARTFSGNTRNTGAVLLLTMVFLMLLATLGASAMQTSILEFQMAGNAHFREEARQRAQAIASAISDNEENFPVIGAIGFTLCKAANTAPECNTDRFITLDSGLEAAHADVGAEYSVVRQGPLLLPSLPFRQLQSSVSSSLAYEVAIFETRVKVGGLALVEVVQGIAVLKASTTGMNAE